MDIKELLNDLRETLTKRLGDESEARKELDSRLQQLEDGLGSYAKQLASLSGGDGSDPHYKGLFPNERMAADFGSILVCAASPDGSMRAKVAERIAKANYTLRTVEGKAVKPEDYVKDLGIGTDTGGGYLTPQELTNTLIRNVEAFSVFRSNVRKAPMSSGIQRWPKRTGGITVYYPDEGQAATESDVTLGQVTLTAKKWAVLTFVSKELEEDALPLLGELIALEFALGLARAEETNGFMGDGTSEFAGVTGVFNSPNVPAIVMSGGDTSFEDITPTYLTKLVTAVPSWAKQAQPAYYASPEIIGLIMELKDDVGRPVYNRPVEGFEFKVNGYPVRESSVLPGLSDDAVSTPFIAFGSLFLWGILGQRRAMTIERSDEVRKLQGQVALLAMPRQDIQEADGNAMAVLTTAAA